MPNNCDSEILPRLLSIREWMERRRRKEAARYGELKGRLAQRQVARPLTYFHQMEVVDPWVDPFGRGEVGLRVPPSVRQAERSVPHNKKIKILQDIIIQPARPAVQQSPNEDTPKNETKSRLREIADRVQQQGRNQQGWDVALHKDLWSLRPLGVTKKYRKLLFASNGEKIFVWLPKNPKPEKE